MAKFTSTTRTAPHAKLTQTLIHGQIHQHHQNCVLQPSAAGLVKDSHVGKFSKVTQASIYGQIHKHHQDCSSCQAHSGFDPWPHSPAPPELLPLPRSPGL